LFDYELNIEYDLKADDEASIKPARRWPNQKQNLLGVYPPHGRCELLPCPNYGRATWDSARRLLACNRDSYQGGCYMTGQVRPENHGWSM